MSENLKTGTNVVLANTLSKALFDRFVSVLGASVPNMKLSICDVSMYGNPADDQLYAETIINAVEEAAKMDDVAVVILDPTACSGRSDSNVVRYSTGLNKWKQGSNLPIKVHHVAFNVTEDNRCFEYHRGPNYNMSDTEVGMDCNSLEQALAHLSIQQLMS